MKKKFFIAISVFFLTGCSQEMAVVRAEDISPKVPKQVDIVPSNIAHNELLYSEAEKIVPDDWTPSKRYSSYYYNSWEQD